jgi:hypothetical protein
MDTRQIRFTAILLTLICLLFLLANCRKKDTVDPDSSLKLSFSADTVFFDTVFTTIGSVTQALIVYNDHDRKVNISSISLAGGNGSEFRLNIDGSAVLTAQDVEIAGHDSLFIFVRVTVDPNNQNLPFIVRDSILFHTNGNEQDVKLVAWGQNARFHKEENLAGNQVWDSLLPHVIFGYLRVDTLASLTIMPGTKVYFHKDALLSVLSNASLKVFGNLDHPVRFQGDRLDPFYRDLPGQWKGIFLERGSVENEINYGIIRNGIYGIVVDSMPGVAGPALTLDNTIIRNTAGEGIFAYSTSIVSINCVIANNGGSALYVEKGGSYDFRQLTIGNYWTRSVRTAPSLVLSNYTYNMYGEKITYPLEKAYFGNTIIYGSNPEEMGLYFDETADSSCQFDHCLIRTEEGSFDPGRYIGCMVNEDPLFINPAEYNFHIDSLSPAIDKGIQLGIFFDIEGNRRGTTPDLGAYEWTPAR